MTQPFSPPLAPTRLRKTGNRWRTIAALVLREMQSRYGRSPGGYIWAIFEPLGMILIMAIAFSLLLRSPSLGNSFLLFYATGFLPYNMYSGLARTTASALSFSRALMSYPVVIWLDAVMGRVLLNSLTGLLVSFIIMTSILVIVDTNTLIDFSPIIVAYTLTIMLGVGVGLVNCVLIAFFPIWSTAWGIINRPLFIASGVIVIYEDMPTVAQNILWYNPLMHVTGIMRTGFYPMYAPQYVSVTYVLSVALVLLALGFMLMRRFNIQILKR